MKRLEPKNVKYIMLHCSATFPGQQCDAEIINGWHRQRGFDMIGYHYVVHTDGFVEHGRPLYQQGAHCAKGGMNAKSIGICYIGGYDADGSTADTRTAAQKEAIQRVIANLRLRFPDATIIGHRDVDAGKACPCFDVKAEFG